MSVISWPTPNNVNYAQGNAYSNMYNLKWSYKNSNTLFSPNHAPVTPPGFQGQKGASADPQKSNLELMMEIFIMNQTLQNKDFLNQNIHAIEMIK